ncbi:MAG: hypothetical protein ABFS45_06545 [Pseudomonadota bacterium]
MGSNITSIEDAAHAPVPLQTTVDELAKLPPLEYEQRREKEASALKVRISVLDKEVEKARHVEAEEAADNVVERLDPWDEPVNGDDLLKELSSLIDDHVITKKGSASAIAAWALGSFCLDAFRVFPKLQIKSPERRCGKTTLIEVLEGITCRPMVTSNISAAAVFRSIEEWQPTLLIDEADTFAKDNDELNGIINAGHTRRTAHVTRVEKVDDKLMPKRFSAWCPQVIAGI